MYDLLFHAYELVTHMIPFLAVLLLRQRKQPLSGPLCYGIPVLFALYVIAVFHVTGAGTLYDGIRNLPYGLFNRINPFPFYNRIDPVAYVLNVVMFLPFGFLIPAMCPGSRTVTRVALGGFCFSLLIEVSQMLSLRGTDVDDLIMNTLGAVLGYLMFQLWDRFSGAKPKVFSSAEPVVWILAIYLGRFLLYHPLGLVKLLYGF